MAQCHYRNNKYNLRFARAVTFALASVIIFSLICGYIFMRSYKNVTAGLFESIGAAAQDMALLISHQTEFSMEDFENLKKLSYAEAMRTPECYALWKMIANLPYHSQIKRVYIIIKLDADEKLCRVTPKAASGYREPQGTVLDGMRLFDVLCDSEGKQQTSNMSGWGDYYKDSNRYMKLTEAQLELFDEQLPRHIMQNDEWGSLITGFAPLFTKEGQFIGMLGVEINFAEYAKAIERSVKETVGSFCVAFGVLLVTLFFSLHLYWTADERAKYLDPLTSVFNRRYYDDKLAAQLRKRQRGSTNQLLLIMMDLDHFKQVNDTFGHQTGDLYLMSIKDVYVMAAGATPSILMRLGGEEFLAAASVTGREEALSLLEKLLQLFRSNDPVHNGYIVTVSLGALLLPADAPLDRKSLFKYISEADSNLYKAKEEGRDRFCLTEA